VSTHLRSRVLLIQGQECSKVSHGDSQCVVQITKEGIKGVFNGVLSDFGDRMLSDGMSTLGTISFQQFKPTDLKASYNIFLVAIASHAAWCSTPQPTYPSSPTPFNTYPTQLTDSLILP